MYGLQFTYEFYEAIQVTPAIPQARYRVRFFRKDYTGEVTELLPGKDVVKIPWKGKDGDIFEPTLSSTASFSLAAQSYWDVADLVVVDARQMQVTIERDPNPADTTSLGHGYQPYWSGWVRAAKLTEDYAAKPYPIEVSAWDGLEALTDAQLVDSNGTRLSGKVSLSQTLRTALNLTDSGVPLITAVNIFNSSDVAVGQSVGGLVDQARDPLYRTQVQAETFVGADGLPNSALSAIEEVSKPFGIRTALVNGKWMSFRAVEMAGGYDVWAGGSNTSLHIRQHNSPDTFAPATSDGSIDLSATVSRVGVIRAENGQTYQQGIARSVKVEQKFGRFLNKLPNGDFAEADETGFPVGWVKNNVPASGPLAPHIVGTNTESDPRGLFIYGAGDEKFNNDTPWVGRTINYAVGSVERGLKPIARTLKGRFKTQNVRAGKIVVIAQRRNSATNKTKQYILQEGGAWKEDPGKKDMKGILIYHTAKDLNGYDIAKTGYADINITMQPLDGVERISIFLCAGEALDLHDGNGRVIGPNTGPPTPYVIYENIRFEAYIEGVDLDGTQRTIAKPGKKVDTNLTLTIGDVPDAAFPYDRIGALLTRQGIPTTKWWRGDEPTTSAGPPNNGNSLLDLRTKELARQTMQPANTFEGVLTGYLPYGPQTVLYFDDIGEVVNGVLVPYPFLITSLESSLRMCSHRVTAIRLMQTTPTGIPPVKKEYQTPDGTLLIEDEDVEPSIPKKPTLNDIINGQISNRVPVVLVGTPHNPGFTAITGLSTRLIGTALNNGVPLAQQLSGLRQIQKITFP